MLDLAKLSARMKARREQENRFVWIDTETYSETSLRTCGSYRYFEDPDFEIMLFQYAIGNGPVRVLDWTDGMYLPDELQERIDNPSVRFFAHNAMFDRVALRTAGFEWADTPDRWFCTMAAANLHQLPASLDKLCQALNVSADKAKLKTGRDLMRLFCMPRPKNHKLRRATKHTHPEQWEQFKEYGGNDILAMRECYRKMPKWNITAGEVALWRLDQKINDRGIYLDQDLARAAVRNADKVKKKYSAETVESTHGYVESTNQVDKLLVHLLAEYGVGLDDMKAGTVEKAIESGELHDEVVALLTARLGASKTTATKFKTALRAVCHDGRLHGLLAFAAAERTCRWAGRLVQPQNLMRTPKYLHNKLPEAIEALELDVVDVFYDSPMEVIAACARPMLRAAPGHILAVVDLSNIEGRGLSWQAGEQWRLKAFRDLDAGIGEDLYVLGYSKSFGVSIETINKDTEDGGSMRLIGKVQELALGFQGAVGAFVSMAANYGVFLDEARILQIVKAWREASPNIVNWWWALDRAFRRAIKTPGKWFECECVRIRKDGAWLRIQLPSGRMLCFPGARINADGDLDFLGQNRYNANRWERINIYAGKIAQGITQANARDVLAANMPTAETEGFPLVGTVHDELITEIPERDAHRLGELKEIVATVPSFAKGLPLSASGYTSPFYLKD